MAWSRPQQSQESEPLHTGQDHPPTFWAKRARGRSGQRLRRGGSEEDPNLTVFNSSSSAAVLPPNTSGLRAFLEKAGLIEDQHCFGGLKVLENVLAEVVRDDLRIPLCRGQQALHAEGRALTDLLAVLALNRAEEGLQVREGPLTLSTAGETGRHPLVEHLQVSRPVMGLKQRGRARHASCSRSELQL